MSTLDQVSQQQAHAVTVNANFDAVAASALFGVKQRLTTGLTFAYYGGIIGGYGAFTTIADGTLALTGSATNYIEATTAGVISSNTSAFTAGRVPLYTAVTNTTGITTLTDYRVQAVAFASGGLALTTLAIATGTITADTPALSITQTWNNAGVNFIAQDTNITNTASGASSMLRRWRVGGAVKASIDYLGAMVLAAGLTLSGAIAGATTIAASGTVPLPSAAPQLTLGVDTTTAGRIKLFGSTSGNATITTPAAAGAGITITLPATSVTLNAAASLTGTDLSLDGGVTQTAFANVTTLLTAGGTGASSVFAIPGTLEATGTTGALTVAGGVYVAKAIVSSQGTGHLLGVAANANRAINIGGAFTGSTSSNAVALSHTITIPTNGSAGQLFLIPTTITAASGTHPGIHLFQIAPTFTDNGAAVTAINYIDLTAAAVPAGTVTASGIRVAAPTGGATNWAINVTSGNVNFAGTLGVTGAITGGGYSGGAISGTTGVFTTRIYTIKGNTASIATATPTTIYTVTNTAGNTEADMWEVVVNIGAADAALYSAQATITTDGGSAKITTVDGGQIALTLSGMNVQVTQTTGANQIVYWKVRQM